MGGKMATTAMRMKSGFEVEWTASCPSDGFGGHDLDQADTRYEKFTTVEEARAFAKKVLPKDFFGCVVIRDFEYTEYDEYGLPLFNDEYGNYEEVID